MTEKRTTHCFPLKQLRSTKRLAQIGALDEKTNLYDLLNATKLTTFLMDRDGTVLVADAQLATRLGLEAGDVLGKNIKDFFPPKEAENLFLFAADAIRTRQPVIYENTTNARVHDMALCPVPSCKTDLIRLAVYAQDVTEQRQVERKLRESEAKFSLLFENSTDGIFLTRPDGTVQEANPAACEMLGMSIEEIRHAGREGIVAADDQLTTGLRERDLTGRFTGELTFIRANGQSLQVEVESSVLPDVDGHAWSFVIFRDITAQKQARFEQEVAISFLEMVNACADTQSLIEATVKFFQEKSGCEAVGVRLKQGDDYPYFEARGFPPEFILAENSLCSPDPNGGIARDSTGNPVLECMCGNIISGRFDPSKPFFTPGGSFWTNSTTELLAGSSEAEIMARTRNRCNGEGYESVALIPLHHGGQRLGLLQLNDRLPGRFTPSLIGMYERLVGHLAVALAKTRAEEKLRSSERRYRRMVETAREGVWLMDVNHRTIYANSHMAEMLGFSPDEMIGCGIESFMFSEDIALRRKQIETFPEDRSSPNERRYRTKNGREIWTIVSTTALKDEDGITTGSFSMLTDITLRKLAEESGRLFEKMASGSKDSLALVGRDYVYRAVNDTFLNRFGRSKEEVIGQHIAKIIDAEVFENILRPQLDKCLGGEEVTFSYWFTYPLGGRRFLEVSYSPYCGSDGSISGVVVTGRDITERKRSEEVLEARLRLSESSANLTLAELLQQTIDEVACVTGSPSGFIHFVDDDQQALIVQLLGTNTIEKIRNAEGMGPLYRVQDAGAWENCIREGLPVVHNNYTPLAQPKNLQASIIRELLVPIIRQGQILAVMGVRNKPQDYDKRDVERVWSLANLAWDIVLRKKAEERLELQGMVLDQASDHIAITDLQGAITYVNQAQCQALQTQRSDMIGRHVSNLIWAPPTGASQQQIIDATLKEGAWRGEVLYTTSDGRVILVDLRTTLIRSKDGKAIALCGIGNDITEQNKMEQSLRQSEDRFRRIFDESPIAKAIVSPDFRFLRVNEALCRITGYSAEELLAIDFAEITHSDDFTVYLQQAQRLFAGAIDHYDMELRNFHRHGEEVWVHIWIKLILNVADNQMYLLHTLEDITARKKADYELIQSQARLQAMYRDLQNAREKERRRIAREIHDEMGQNLTALKIDMAFLKKLMHPIQDQLNERFEAMEQLFDQTIENVRRISSDLRPGMLDSLGLAAAMEWYVKDFERRTEIQCEIQIDQGEVTVPHDIEIEVFRILQEALTNVARHANAESVLVTLKLTDRDLQLRVVDDGDGIQNEKVSAPTSFGLLGVGERVAAHNGEFKISGRIGEGTALKVIIPLTVRGDEN